MRVLTVYLEHKGMNRYKNYKDYKVEHFLNDDSFICSILSPTEESERYWNDLVSSGALDIYTYTEAVLILSGWKQSVPVADKEDLVELWHNIEADIIKENRIMDQMEAMPARHRKKQVWKLAAIPVAAAAVAAAILMIPGLKEWKTRQGGQVEPGFVMMTQAQESDKVVIVSDSKELYLEGNHPVIQYDQGGILNVTVSESKEKDEGFHGTAVSPASQKVEVNQVSVPYGKTASLTLSDGTVLQINAGTKVSYPLLFPESTREIQVDGEVFATVTPDSRPFIVHTKDMDVKVKGTRFDLSCYTADDFAHVVLVEGSVNVSHTNGEVSLLPRQAFFSTTEGTSVRIVNTDLYTSWTQGIYKFENEPIENVLVKLARYYNVTLILPETPSGVICYGSLELRDNFSTILAGLMEIASFNFIIKDGAYTIRWDWK